MSAERIAEIKSAADQVISRAQLWCQDDKLPPNVPDDVAISIGNADVIAHSGDIPQSCQELAVQLAVLNENQRKYDQSEHGARMPDGGPSSAWWASLKSVMKAREGANGIKVVRMESVADLLKQNVSRMQIAGCIYGHRGVGPLMQENGVPDDVLIDKERDTPGSVLIGWPDWIPPWQSDVMAQQRREAQGKLAAIDRRENGRQQYVDPGTIESMLKDKCYIQQIMKGKQVSRKEVLEVAMRLGLSAVDQPGAVIDDDDDLESETEESETASLPAKEISKLAVEIYEQSERKFGPAEVAAELKARGHDVPQRSVSNIIGHYNRKIRKEGESVGNV